MEMGWFARGRGGGIMVLALVGRGSTREKFLSIFEFDSFAQNHASMMRSFNFMMTPK